MSYGSNNRFVSGKWNVICDVCGFQFKSNQVRKRWDGLYVCNKDYELDHPQKHLRVHEDSQTVQFIRSEPEDVFVAVCFVWAIGAYADLGTADCMQADHTTQTYLLLKSIRDAGSIT